MLKCVQNRKHLLLVEDDSSVSQMLSMLLQTRGFAVSVASTGVETYAKVQDTTDLILLDLILPDEDGFNVCRKLKENPRTRHIPIIILSGKMLPQDIVEGLYLGADDYLTKPFECDELIARIDVICRRYAHASGHSVSSQGEEAIILELRRIINEKLIIPYYQPIFLLKQKSLYGVEALSRPQTESMLSNAELLFKAAMQFGMYQDLELMSWKKMINQASELIGTKKLFLNCNPYLVEGPKFLTIKSLFDESRINRSNVVLEITERSVISQYKVFYEHLALYRNHGFQFAVDDVGGGYASLESIVETKPEVVKVDRHIVNGISNDSFKKSIVKFVVAFCRENNILSIAEGIETQDDLSCLIEIGVDAGQGYFLGKPTSDLNIATMQQFAEQEAFAVS